MKDIGLEDWLIEGMMDLYNMIRNDVYAAKITNTVKQITGKKPISLLQFAEDYAEFFR